MHLSLAGALPMWPLRRMLSTTASAAVTSQPLPLVSPAPPPPPPPSSALSWRGLSLPADVRPSRQPGGGWQAPALSARAVARLRKHTIFLRAAGAAAPDWTALDAAAWRPGRVISLIIGASYGQVQEPEITAFFQRVNSPDFQRVPGVLREVGATYRGTDPEGVARWVAIEHHAKQDGALAQPLRTPNTYAKIASIACPALVIAAGADLYAPPPLMRLWAAHLAGHEWHELPYAGHAINWEEPAAFNALVLGFLGRGAKA